MNSPVVPDTTLQKFEIEPGLEAYLCPKSGGVWIPLQSYLNWKERHATAPPAPATEYAPAFQDDSQQRALICPESGRLLLRYRVGHGLPFHLDRSPATGGVWLDRGEWEALKARGLYASLHLVFTASYQGQIRALEYNQKLTAAFQDRIGAADFSRVAEFAEWLANHPKRRDIGCYLLDRIEQGAQTEQAPNETGRKFPGQ